MSVRELYRRELGKATVDPSSSFQESLMHHLARREFMHFIPSKFNIYYLGAILLAGVTAGLLIFTTSSSDLSGTPGDKFSNPDSAATRFIDIQKVSPVRVEKDTVYKSVSVKSEIKEKAEDNNNQVTGIEKRDTEIVNEVAVAGVMDSIRNNGMFETSKPGARKLKESYRSGTTLFGMSSTKGCAPLKIQFLNNAGSFDSCRWTFGDGGYSDEINPDWIYDVDGEYRVTLQVFRRDGYHASSSALITVFPKPRARFEISPQKAIIPNDRITFLNYSTDAVRFRWDFGDGDTSELFEPVHKYDKYGNYNISLVAYSESGCSDSLTVRNAFSDSQFFIEFPNAFIPNTGGSTGGLYSSKSDEAAQVFHPVFSGVAEYQLKIFSKLGVLIFESNDLNIGWDGYYNGQLCNPGVYIWKVRGTFINGEPFVNMGDVTLLKNQ